ncbi:MAG: hypothetical protein IKS33_09285 [Bacteroidales bacterium]|nr:hypothetical protein [Bacteroidales bacterium]
MEYLAELLKKKLSKYSKEELDALFAKCEEFASVGPLAEDFLNCQENYCISAITNYDSQSAYRLESKDYSLAA